MGTIRNFTTTGFPERSSVEYQKLWIARQNLHAQAILEQREFTPAEEREWQRLDFELERVGKMSQGRLTHADSALPPGTSFGGTRNENGYAHMRAGLSDGGFSGLPDFLLAAYKTLHGHRDERLLAISTTGTGGYALPSQLVVNLMEGNLEDTVLMKACQRVQMDTHDASIPGFVDDDHESSGAYGIDWAVVAEGAEYATSDLTLNQVNLHAHKFGTRVYVNNEWLKDAATAARLALEKNLVGSLHHFVEKTLWRGSGAVIGGALNANSVVEVDAETGQAPDTVVIENVLKMRSRLLPTSWNRCIWCANPAAHDQLSRLTITSGTGGMPVGLLQPSIAGPTAETVFGRPLHVTEHLPALGAAGDVVVLDPSLFVLGDRREVLLDVSAHERFSFDQTVFRCSVRFDAQPLMRAAMTCEDGVTRSWCVTLAAR
ncbi:MAG: phage major capsid protein [Phycisphaerae bacterium]|nr:phage major capsid protein [Phycisphaerae bacterium]